MLMHFTLSAYEEKKYVAFKRYEITLAYFRNQKYIEMCLTNFMNKITVVQKQIHELQSVKQIYFSSEGCKHTQNIRNREQ
jgi:thiamine pyrophosphokinase